MPVKNLAVVPAVVCGSWMSTLGVSWGYPSFMSPQGWDNVDSAKLSISEIEMTWNEMPDVTGKR